ncbi:MAG: hypothetical protein NUV34_07220, partial [Sulfuricaulis sp.]|nr:hypothetical protein [Sulfuricaulis sp.]
PVLWIDLLPRLQFGILVKVEGGESFSKNPAQWVISADKGKTRIDLFGTFTRAWNEGRIPRDVGKLHHLQDPSLKLVELATMDKDSQLAWRPVEELTMAYTVSRRAWLGSFSPEECRGILNYSNGTFTVSHLPIGVLPKQRDASWNEIEDPDKLAVSIPGTVITTEGWQVDPNTAQFGGAEIQFADAEMKWHKLEDK